ncbi:MAG: hypothetical protein ACXWPM_04780 [Bdellovibrionota bacterium]
MSIRRVLACAVALSTALPIAVPARSWADDYKKQESEIPQITTRPEALPVRTPNAPFNCARFFMVDGRKFDCDSYVQQDGEHLRSLIQDVPDAVNQLNAYQRHLRNVKTAAYIATGSALAGVASYLFMRFVTPTVDVSIRNSISLGLVIAAVIPGIYAWVSIQVNERHLTNAVNNYNSSRPDKPIELMFTTGFHF